MKVSELRNLLTQYDPDMEVTIPVVTLGFSHTYYNGLSNEPLQSFHILEEEGEISFNTRLESDDDYEPFFEWE